MPGGFSGLLSQIFLTGGYFLLGKVGLIVEKLILINSGTE